MSNNNDALQQAIREKLKPIQDDLQAVINYCDQIIKATYDMYNAMQNNAIPCLTSIAENHWKGGTAIAYFDKVNKELTGVAEASSEIKNSTEKLAKDYVAYTKKRIEALGLNPKEVFPDLYK